jgi:hypothetical protein
MARDKGVLVDTDEQWIPRNWFPDEALPEGF